MKTLALLMTAVLLIACRRQNDNGGTGSGDNTPAIGRGAGTGGDTGGNGKVYDRGGPPSSGNPSSQKQGSGRIDTGGGATAGGAINNSVPTNIDPQGPAGAR